MNKYLALVASHTCTVKFYSAENLTPIFSKKGYVFLE
jgi:hypothetical protein